MSEASKSSPSRVVAVVGGVRVEGSMEDAAQKLGLSEAEAKFLEDLLGASGGDSTILVERAPKPPWQEG